MIHHRSALIPCTVAWTVLSTRNSLPHTVSCCLPAPRLPPPRPKTSVGCSPFPCPKMCFPRPSRLFLCLILDCEVPGQSWSQLPCLTPRRASADTNTSSETDTSEVSDLSPQPLGSGLGEVWVADTWEALTLF